LKTPQALIGIGASNCVKPEKSNAALLPRFSKCRRSSAETSEDVAFSRPMCKNPTINPATMKALPKALRFCSEGVGTDANI
jgi:hypothetical protein